MTDASPVFNSKCKDIIIKLNKEATLLEKHYLCKLKM